MSKVEDFNQLESDEHVRLRPDTYIGDIDNVTENRWIYNENNNRMELKEVTYNPGLEQCVMELITNATDRAQNIENKVTKINVSIDEEIITVMNNGISIPIEIHPKSQKYVPELIFGNMLSSSNFNKTKRTVGGKNGIGAKAANIFSNSFVVTVINNGTKYIQKWEDQMKVKHEPKITKVKAEDSVTISYEPCHKVFDIKSIHNDDTVPIIYKRVLDASAVTGNDVIVTFNKLKIKVKNFEDYMNLYIGNKKEAPRVIYEINRWSVGFAINPYPNATQISFVNGIFTDNGGTHVNHVLDPLVNKVHKELQDKNKDLTIKKSYIKDNIIVFVKSIIEDPTFNSQTKRQHTTKITKFGSKCELPDKVIKDIIKLGITKGVVEVAKAKEIKNLKKLMEKRKVKFPIFQNYRMHPMQEQ